ncbi:BlaI/MecI/CopY family transcriptional regulator [Micromonospora mirobrigensis]|uniref:Predicted transcriptional regulator n=1 Tax=Micromonospora mirobrigensis TaxID=262898 RepID=A0A1C4WDM8_9ACTN|nr:BlaI/MecI/CopY family transcriptional regulator [Micromonospora mirobrigensis]SCE94346.1 Predicted transcriptional regulator [Micromonospora mirobrigensis]
MKSRRRGHGDLEHEILAVLAAAEAPLAPAAVRERLDPALAYNTVTTVLGRLHDKGRVTRLPAGRGYTYQAVRDRAQVVAHQMRRLLDDDADRSAVLTRFVGALTPEDEALLVTLLQRAEPDHS